jgi:hypothetical protein
MSRGVSLLHLSSSFALVLECGNGLPLWFLLIERVFESPLEHEVFQKMQWRIENGKR